MNVTWSNSLSSAFDSFGHQFAHTRLALIITVLSLKLTPEKKLKFIFSILYYLYPWGGGYLVLLTCFFLH